MKSLLAALTILGFTLLARDPYAQCREGNVWQLACCAELADQCITGRN